MNGHRTQPRARRLCCAAVAIVLAASVAIAAAAGTVRAAQEEDPYRLEELAQLPLDVEILKERADEGIRIVELKYTSEVYHGEPVRIYGIYAAPAEPTGQVPAILWGQAGLYQASDYFPVLLAKRGYGCLCIDAPFRGYRSTGVAGYDVWHIANPISDHSAVRIARAFHRGVSYLVSRPEIDPERIGAAGSSWGGYAVLLTAGLDERIKVVSTFFGSGNLHLGSAWLGEIMKNRGPDLERWRQLYDPAARLPARKDLAVMITTGTNDQFYKVPAVSQTYLDTLGDRRLGWIPHYNHALTERGDEMVFEFIDHHLRPGAGVPFNEVADASVAARGGKLMVTFTCRGQREAAEASVHFSYGLAGNWEARLWDKAMAKLVDEKWEAEVPVLRPELPLAWYAEVTDTTGAFIGTDVRMATPKDLGIVGATAQASGADGCFYGDFEAEDMVYLQRSGQPVAPADTAVAHTGKQSLRLEAKDGDLSFSTDYVRWCPAFDGDLTAWLRGTGGEVELALGGAVDGRPVGYSVKTTTGEQWQKVGIRFPACKPEESGVLHWTIHVPAGQTVWLDTLRFRLVP